jgi:hypothetical protein
LEKCVVTPGDLHVTIQVDSTCSLKITNFTMEVSVRLFNLGWPERGQELDGGFRCSAFLKICLAEHYKFVIIPQTCRLIPAEVKAPRLNEVDRPQPVVERAAAASFVQLGQKW